MPSDDSLKLHWLRTCYVVNIWRQADKTLAEYEPLSQWGWCYSDEGELIVKWDSEDNF